MPLFWPWLFFWVRPVLLVGAPINIPDPPFVIWPRTIVFRPVWWTK
jgi:hypothetical protein